MPIIEETERLAGLRAKAHAEGYVTHRELADALCKNKDLNDPATIEQLIEDIEATGARVVAQAPVEARESARTEQASADKMELEEVDRAWLRRAGKLPLLNHEQEISIARRMENPNSPADARVARDLLVSSNLRLVASVARRYVGHGVPIEDLMSEGTIGLIRAVDRFNYRKGYRFSTYAIWWIRRCISRAIAEQSRLIRLPVHVTDTLGRLNKTRSSLRDRLGRTPTRAELAEAMRITEEKLADLMRSANVPLSLEAPVGEDGDTRMGDLVAATEVVDPSGCAELTALRDEIGTALVGLTKRERDVIVLRYGLEDNDPRTLEEVGRALEITRERVRQIEALALQKLRKNPGTHRIRDLVG